jgi:hypothetical protein
LGIIVGHIYFFSGDAFPNQHGRIRILETPSIMRTIFNAQMMTQIFSPLPEERTGGFSWGEDQRLGDKTRLSEIVIGILLSFVAKLCQLDRF